ncbi:MAG: acetyl-CoA carboxylase biotin carboxyl carrier protein [Planctomycetes bacterium]|nr:acetyl-CoA carboxylase biotin carboxyl carrier protein [Planctomycetota bacterium]
MAENDLTAIELRDGEEQVSIKRRTNEAPVVVAAPVQQVAGPPLAQAMNTEQQVQAPAPPADDPDAGLVPIASPMVGTFYSAPKPDADPFVNVGTSVTPNSLVCIIEAMKVFNEIKAEVSGTIERVLVANEAPVEYGQPLFLVRPSG